MATIRHVREFHSEWSPTVTSFLRLYSGDREFANAMASDAFCEYMATGLPLETTEMPIGLWECAVDVARRAQRKPLKVTENSEFESAILFLPRDQRLIFLLHSFFALPTLWIALITGLPVKDVQELSVRSSDTMRVLLGFPVNTPPSVIETYAVCHRSATTRREDPPEFRCRPKAPER